jgi:hypothetical protein
VYDGIDITINARFGGGGVIGGGFATGRTVTDLCDIYDDVPEAATSNAPMRFCKTSPPWSALTQVKLFGTYMLPWEVRVSANFQHVPGVNTTARYTVSGADMTAGLGRAPSAGARATAAVELIEPQQLYREDSLNQLNVALTKILSLGTYRIQPTIELHNALNASTINVINTTYGPAWQQVRGVLAPRIVKFAVHVDF